MLRLPWRTLLLSSIGLFALFTTCFLGVRVYASPDTTVAAEPRIVVEGPGELFNVTVVVTDVEELFVWELNLTFNPSVLKAVGFFEGPFLQTAGDTKMVPAVYNNTAGWVGRAGALFPYPTHGANGTGTLAYVTFLVKAEGKCNLHFSVARLSSWDPIGGVLILIPSTSIDGMFQYPLLRDVAVTSVISSATSVTAGRSVSINVTVMNRGNVTETFDVSISYNSTAIAAQTVNNLDPEAVDTVDFVWDTKNVAPGKYQIVATAETLSGETNIADNSDSGIVITVAAPPTIPIELLIGVIVVVAVVGVGAFVLVRRRSTKK